MLKNALGTGAILIAVIFLVALFIYPDRPTIGKLPTDLGALSVQGFVTHINEDTKELTIVGTKGNEVVVRIDADTVILNNIGRTIDFSLITMGMELTAIGNAPNSILLYADSILIEHDERDSWAVKPDTLFENSLIPTSYSITGLADKSWFADKGYFFTRVYDGKGELLMRTYVYPQSAPTTTDMWPFTAWLSFDAPLTATGTVSFDRVGITDRTEERIIVPVRFAVQAGTIPIKLFYQNTRKSEALGDPCSLESIMPIVVNMPDTESPIRDSITRLIDGNLSDENMAHGFTTGFPLPDFSLASSTFTQNGTLTLEFTKAPGFTMGGSCRVQLLAHQIESTAKQFKSVKKVVLLPADLFQP